MSLQDAPERCRIDIGKGFWMEYDEFLVEGYVVVVAIAINTKSKYNSTRALESMLRLLLFDRLYGEDYMTIYVKHRYRLPKFSVLFRMLQFEEIPRNDFPKEYQAPRSNKAVKYYKRQAIKSNWNRKEEKPMSCNSENPPQRGNIENLHKIIDCPNCDSQMHSWNGGKTYKCENPNCNCRETRG